MSEYRVDVRCEYQETYYVVAGSAEEALAMFREEEPSNVQHMADIDDPEVREVPDE